MIVDRNSEFGGIDLSLNRSLEELISSYYEAHGAGIELDEDSRPEEIDAYFALENYLADFGAIKKSLNKDNVLNELQDYLLLKTIQFMRWINLPDEHWIWLDNNIFNGVL